MSAIFVNYRDNYINFAKIAEVYQLGEFETDRDLKFPLWTMDLLRTHLYLLHQRLRKHGHMDSSLCKFKVCFCFLRKYQVPLYNPVHPFSYDTYKIQDNFGNIIEIEFDWGDEENDDEDWTVKRAIVRYP